jgi:membrane dipeptidase
MKLVSTIIVTVLAATGYWSCQEKRPVDRMKDDDLKKYAVELAHQYIITDGHIDLPYRLKETKFRLEPGFLGIPVHSKEGDFDYERAKSGGLDCPFMSIYVPSSYQLQSDHGKALADSLINMVHGIAEAIPDKFSLALTPDDVRTNTTAGKISLPMGMENGAPIGDDIKNVRYFYDRGIRYVTLTHGKDNQICDSSYDTTATWSGLSPFGRLVVNEMNRVGIMVDISHVSDSAFYQVVRMTHVPVIASHSSCRYFTPGWKRNMDDDMIKALGKNGGVIQISFGSSFLDSVARKNGSLRDSLHKILKAKGLMAKDDAAQSIIGQFTGNPRDLYSDVERVADHIDHVVALIGIDHVGFGSDFDGVEDSLPIGLKDVSMYPNLLYVLLKRGYTEKEIEKICGANLLRVWQEVLDAAH